MQQQEYVPGLLRLAGSLAPMWGTRGYSVEGCAWLEWALPRSDGVSPEVLVVAVRALSWVLLNHDEGSYRSLVAAQYALSLSDEIDDGRNRVASYLLSCFAGNRLGYIDESTGWLFSALREQDRCAGEPWVPVTRCIALNHLAGNEFDDGHIDRAETLLGQVMATQQELGHRFTNAGHVFRGLGDIARARGDPNLALAHYQAALRHACDARDFRSIGTALASIAGTLAELGHYKPAALLFGLAQAHHERIDSHFFPSALAFQRALGLPEPWASMYPECTVADGLRRAQWERTAPIRAVTLDAEQAQAWWDEGRALTIDEAVALIPSLEPSPHRPDERTLSGLTDRETEVLRLVAQGLPDREIAAALFISPRTVQNHVQSIYRKIDVSSRSAATRWAMDHGIA
jgi:DNA-binding CsgD family transcriptional regulator